MRNTNITTADDTNCGRHSSTEHGSPVAPKTPPPPLRTVASVVEPSHTTPQRDREVRSDSSNAPTVQQVLVPPRPSREMPALRNARTSVRRRLFIEHQDEAADDTIWESDNRTNAFLESMRVDRERARQMWNFDFETETPLPGVWQWQRIQDENSLREESNENGSSESNQGGVGETNQQRCAESSCVQSNLNDEGIGVLSQDESSQKDTNDDSS